MEVKYCVICVDGDGCVRSVDPFDSEKEAEIFLAEEAFKIYKQLLDVPDSILEVRPGFAKVFGEGILIWSLWSLSAKRGERCFGQIAL